jgi:hypothetical protein
MSMIKLSARDKALTGLPSINVRINQKMILCEFASTQEQRETGLMYRNFLTEPRGMVFRTFGRYRPQFHMANVKFNLDGIFVGNDMRVADVVPMLKMDVSSLYTTTRNIPIAWVIEVPFGFCNRNNIGLGDRVFIGNY